MVSRQDRALIRLLVKNGIAKTAQEMGLKESELKKTLKGKLKDSDFKSLYYLRMLENLKF